MSERGRFVDNVHKVLLLAGIVGGVVLYEALSFCLVKEVEKQKKPRFDVPILRGLGKYLIVDLDKFQSFQSREL